MTDQQNEPGIVAHGSAEAQPPFRRSGSRLRSWLVGWL